MPLNNSSSDPCRNVSKSQSHTDLALIHKITTSYNCYTLVSYTLPILYSWWLTQCLESMASRCYSTSGVLESKAYCSFYCYSNYYRHCIATHVPLSFGSGLFAIKTGHWYIWLDVCIKNVHAGTNSVGEKRAVHNCEVTISKVQCCPTVILALKSGVFYIKFLDRSLMKICCHIQWT